MKNRRTVRMAQPYVEGNAVRKGVAGRRTQSAKAAAKAKKRREREREILSPEEKQRIREEREQDHLALQERLRGKAVPLDRPFLWLLILASSVTLYLCFHYIQLKTRINAQAASIKAKEQKLERMRSENDALENSIYTSIDLDEVYRIATEELGMVYAGEDQVITFEKTESEYVRQYEKIPKY